MVAQSYRAYALVTIPVVLSARELDAFPIMPFFEARLTPGPKPTEQLHQPTGYPNPPQTPFPVAISTADHAPSASTPLQRTTPSASSHARTCTSIWANLRI
ncbi:hypothetical protein BDK51DRAFT_40153 [Blyttiomyces helicus]|uniref:Uncharacterized protein n=1 Tax=Blyttiomyces helicus TaxID=388810 RepID=A0A4V1ISN3_9FUNG|nr:hypothetical protein BDK51DRAFT_40153 [Blyttiomyces helicus]|eukprot:RKO94157.1 hypothetical protein BDK51DRAFT_40153 [Blyttiomyces helicus]